MDFWQIISENCESPLKIDEASTRLQSALGQMSAEEVLEFCGEFNRKMDEAYTWDLWGVAYLLNGGCGDDSFMDFRSSLIASGKHIFEKALADAESLVMLEKGQLAELFEEGLLYCGPNAYEAITGHRPEPAFAGKRSPSGREWEESRESLQQRFPKVWSIYGWEELPPENAKEPKRPWWKFW